MKQKKNIEKVLKILELFGFGVEGKIMSNIKQYKAYCINLSNERINNQYTCCSNLVLKLYKYKSVIFKVYEIC
jgi:hypothetical protein